MTPASAADRDPSADGVCGAWGPMQARRDPARCQVHAGHTGRHYAYTDEGDRGPRWRGEYVPLEAPSGEVFFTLPPDDRRGRLPTFYRQHPDWTQWRQIHENDLVKQACRKYGIGARPEDIDLSSPHERPEPEPETVDAPDTQRQQEPAQPPLCPAVEELDGLEEHECRGWWVDHSDELDADVRHVCTQRPETCRDRPSARSQRHQCACGKNRTVDTHGTLEATARPEQTLAEVASS